MPNEFDGALDKLLSFLDALTLLNLNSEGNTNVKGDSSRLLTAKILNLKRNAKNAVNYADEIESLAASLKRSFITEGAFHIKSQETAVRAFTQNSNTERTRIVMEAEIVHIIVHSIEDVVKIIITIIIGSAIVVTWIAKEEAQLTVDLSLRGTDIIIIISITAEDRPIPQITDGPWLKELEAMNIQLTDVVDSGPIEILFGADVIGELYTGRKHALNCGIFAIETLFGWTLMGRIPLEHPRCSTAMTEWSAFVRNRVSEIRTLTDVERWSHVPGAMNPADLPSRGCGTSRLIESRWWEGPAWLRDDPSAWPKEDYNIDEEKVNVERKKSAVVLLTTVSNFCNLTQFSSYNKTIRMVAWMKRFCFNARNPSGRLEGTLLVDELKAAEIFVLKMSSSIYWKPGSFANAFISDLDLPPTDNAFKFHIGRAFLQCAIYKTAHLVRPNIPDIIQFGRFKKDVDYRRFNSLVE
ncbi:hypothetical protein NQ315_000521 [Exocentrus adspersus]|uniref:Peptidase aspartic putative domain-containing protein n=1 Tax=Exocentrus adspersus TaxID=1586481 RepID=A0AAV8VD36_9CUCU|nr:hypothetical protein NQ315_000521 [Exocentrus adspersus]